MVRGLGVCQGHFAVAFGKAVDALWVGGSVSLERVPLATVENVIGGVVDDKGAQLAASSPKIPGATALTAIAPSRHYFRPDLRQCRRRD